MAMMARANYVTTGDDLPYFDEIGGKPLILEALLIYTRGQLFDSARCLWRDMSFLTSLNHHRWHFGAYTTPAPIDEAII